MKGRPYTYYFADITEHGRTKKTDDGVKWDGAWEYTSTMIIKSAVSYALRIAMGITGVVPYDELSPEDRKQYGRDTAEVDEEPRQAAELPEDFWDGIREAAGSDHLLGDLIELTRDWPPARIEMTLSGHTAEGLSTLRDQLRAAAPEEETIAEAVVVDEKPDPELKLNENADAATEEPDVDALDEAVEDDEPEEVL